MQKVGKQVEGMIQFPEEYFKREVQDGHVVGELIKRAWAAQLEVLKQIDAICNKYDLTYFAYWGTLLGAVRHNGFIPWDDDMDIAMKREEYNKFLEVAPQELPQSYHILSDYTEEEWENTLTRITNGDKVDFDERKMQEFHNCPFVVGIDVFPLDYISRNQEEAEEQKQILTFIGTLLTVLKERKEAEERGTDIELLQMYNQEIAESLVTLEHLCGVHFDNSMSIGRQLYVLYDQVAALFTEEESDMMTSMSNYLKSGYIVPKELLQEFTWVPFENTKIRIPNGYDAILRKTYGDYMIPRKGGSTHGDLCFRGQIEKLAAGLDSRVKTIVPEDVEATFWEQVHEKVGNGEEKKKVILVHNSTLETLAHDADVIRKLREVFQTFAKNPEVVLWWRPCRADAAEMGLMKKVMPQLIEEYTELIREYQAESVGVFDPGIGMAKVLECCDAYYGDDNKIAKVFQLSGKPVMVADYKMSTKV